VRLIVRGKAKPPIPEPIVQLQRQLDQFRSTQPRRSKLPESLWEAAVELTGIVSTQQGRRIALYFTGRQHAGENLRDVLQHRTADLAPPLQMCDALSRNTPKLSDGAEILLAHCLAHGRRQFVKWPRTSRNPAVMFSKRWAKSINMMRKRASTIYRQPSASRFISSTAAR
jgi:hypothetical protein